MTTTTDMPFELVDNPTRSAVIKVIGVGGGGGNAVRHMIASGVQGVDFVAANTDAQALGTLDGPTTLQLGAEITKGLGAGTSPEVGRQSAIEDRDRIHDVLAGADMVFITAGMGGGTGTGAAPVVAEVAKEIGALAVAVVTKPFEFENRTKVAEQGIVELSQHVDSVIAISNDRLPAVFDDDATMDQAFAAVDDVLLGAVRGISDIIIRPGRINVDFADVRTVMSERGMAIMGTGQASGDSRARDAIEEAINSPLLEDVDLRGARGVVVNITTAPSVGIREFQEIGNSVRDLASKGATVVIGTVSDETLGDEMRITVVATGLGNAKSESADTAGSLRNPVGVTNYRDLDRPTVMRNNPSNQEVATRQVPSDPDYLDIPAFLRRQAD
ncbi:MAG: cell division protein FtsZ [Gammaproteobacteria bacterium]|nr:cell division protein FtsZ [Gammaproteobacteria bacterium]MDE0193130.1 cell division protein FtsZ [Gammaproteobacteria bacterium]